jgi:hypothetical protein
VTVAGLRGSLTLIMAADFIIHSDFYSGGPVGELAAVVLSWQLCRCPPAPDRVSRVEQPRAQPPPLGTPPLLFH